MTNPVSNASFVPIEKMDFSTISTITPEAILLFCQSRVQALDDKIQSKINDQKTMNNDAKIVDELDEAVMQSVNGLFKSPAESWKSYNQCKANHMVDMYNRTSSPEIRTLIAEKYKLFTGKDMVIEPTGMAKIYAKQDDIPIDGTAIPDRPKEEWAHINANIKSRGEALSKTNELEMIQLQSMMSKRQLTIQLTTQMMQSIADSLKNIVANVK